MPKQRTKVTHLESIGRKFFKEILPDEEPIYNYRPNWLKNPDTGHNLEIDIYYKNLKVGIEMNGSHHFTIDQLKRDRLKKELCEKVSVQLYCIPLKNIKMLYFVRSKLKLNHIQISESLRKRLNLYHKKRHKFKRLPKHIEKKIAEGKALLRYKDLQEKETAFNKIKMELKAKRESCK